MNPLSYDVVDGIKHYKLFINGTWTASSRNALLDVSNPATGEVFARVHQAGTEEIEAAIATSHRASEIWGCTLVAERETTLLKIGEVIADRTDEIRDLLIEECGSVHGKALWEIGYVLDAIRSAAGDARHVMGETMPMTTPGQISISVRKPLGVIAGISPFNSPFLLAMKKIVYALATGNTFILKPSEETPISGLILGDLLQEAGVPEVC